MIRFIINKKTAGKQFILLILPVLLCFQLAGCGTPSKTDTSAAQNAVSVADSKEDSVGKIPDASSNQNSGLQKPADTGLSSASKSDSMDSVSVFPSAGQDCNTVGIILPEGDRQSEEGEKISAGIQAAGFKAELRYGSADESTQISQIKELAALPVRCLIIEPYGGANLSAVLKKVRAAGTAVISYEKLPAGADAADYYAGYNFEEIGKVQGKYIADHLKLDEAVSGTAYQLEIFAGASGDSRAQQLFTGAVEDILRPYIDRGVLNVTSGEMDFNSCAAGWKTEEAQARMDDLLNAFYTGGAKMDAILCPSDTIALGVLNSLLQSYNGGNQPIITGMGCDAANAEYLQNGMQSMSVSVSTAAVAERAAAMAVQVMNGSDVELTGTLSGVPAYFCGF